MEKIPEIPQQLKNRHPVPKWAITTTKQQFSFLRMGDVGRRDSRSRLSTVEETSEWQTVDPLYHM